MPTLRFTSIALARAVGPVLGATLGAFLGVGIAAAESIAPDSAGFAPKAPGSAEIHPYDIPAPPLEERLYGLSTLWSEAKFSFAFFDQVPELDWDRAYQEFIPRVVVADTMYAYYRELQAFVALLRDGHTDVTMPASVAVDVPPIWIEVVEGDYVVVRNAVDLMDRVPVGSEIIAVRGIPVDRYVATRVAPYVAYSTPQERDLFVGLKLLSAPRGEEIPFTIVTPQGERREVAATSTRLYDPNLAYSPALPTFELSVEWPADGIAMVTLLTFADPGVPEKFAALVPELESADAVILDLRLNGGGATGTAAAVLGHFADRELHGSSWTTREHRAAHRVWGAYGSASNSDYGRLDAWTEPVSHPTLRIDAPGRLAGKPVAILSSPYTVSAAEDFLIYADPLEKVTRIGQPTRGSTGQPLPVRLPGGGNARICTKRDTWPDGTDFVGVGIEPHIRVPVTAGDVRSGIDRTLAVAVEHLSTELGARGSDAE